MISGIYCISNDVTGDLYIGSTKDFEKREKTHFSLLNSNKHHSNYLQNAVNKYGLNSFDFKILAKCPIEYLILLEQWFINSLKPVYNMNPNARNASGIKRSKETKEKLSKAHKGKPAKNKGIPISQEQKDKLSLALKGRPSGAKGSKWSEVSKEKLSNTLTGRKLSGEHKQNLSKRIFEYDLSGNVIRIFNSINEVALNVNSAAANISRVLKTNKPFKKRIFKYG